MVAGSLVQFVLMVIQLQHSREQLTWMKAIPARQLRASRALGTNATPLAIAQVPTMKARVVVPWGQCRGTDQVTQDDIM